MREASHRQRRLYTLPLGPIYPVNSMDRAVMNFVILGLCLLVTALAHFGAHYKPTENRWGMIILVFSWLAVFLLLAIAIRGMFTPNVP